MNKLPFCAPRGTLTAMDATGVFDSDAESHLLKQGRPAYTHTYVHANIADLTGMSQKRSREQKSLPRDLPPTAATTARSAPFAGSTRWRTRASGRSRATRGCSRAAPSTRSGRRSHDRGSAGAHTPTTSLDLTGNGLTDAQGLSSYLASAQARPADRPRMLLAPVAHCALQQAQRNCGK